MKPLISVSMVYFHVFLGMVYLHVFLGLLRFRLPPGVKWSAVLETESIPADDMSYHSSSLHEESAHALLFALYKQILVRNDLTPNNANNRKSKYKI